MELRIFLMADAATSALTGQETPDGYYDIPTPKEIMKWVDKKMFDLHMPPTNLEPYHFGLIISKN